MYIHNIYNKQYRDEKRKGKVCKGKFHPVKTKRIFLLSQLN